MTSFSNNEQTRISFSKRSVLSTMKQLQSLEKSYIANAQTKLRQSSKIQDQGGNVMRNMGNFNGNSSIKNVNDNSIASQCSDKGKFAQTSKRSTHIDSKTWQMLQEMKAVGTELETYVSFEENTKRQRRAQPSVEQEHLQEMFKLIEEQDKQKIKELVELWFIGQDNKDEKDDKSEHGNQEKIKKQLGYQSHKNDNNSPSPLAAKNSTSLRQDQNSDAKKRKSSSSEQPTKQQQMVQKSLRQNQQPQHQSSYFQQSSMQSQAQTSSNRSQSFSIIPTNKAPQSNPTNKTTTNSSSSTSVHSPSRNKKSVWSQVQAQQRLDQVKALVIESQAYSFYFIEQLYGQVSCMSAFYCKLADESFYYLLSAFNVAIRWLDTDSSSHSDLTAEFLYKMMFVSQRIFWKRGHRNKDKPIELLCHHFAKSNKEFFNRKQPFESVYGYLARKKQPHGSGKSTKSDTTLLGKNNPLTNFTKSMFSRKKDKPSTASTSGLSSIILQLSADDQFNCLQEATNLMANFGVSTEVSLPVIKSLLAVGSGSGSGGNDKSNDKNIDDSRSSHSKYSHSYSNGTFQYLKGLILDRKDAVERRRIFFKTEVKEKRQLHLKQVLANKNLAEFCLKLTCHSGFLSQTDITIRFVSRYLQHSHRHILVRLPHLLPPQKWVQLVPYNRQLEYLKMKQQVAQKSVPSATQEIITLDVNRSLHIHGERLTPTVLHTLLRTYAFFHQDVSYCQGMNYIAGYLYLKTLNEQSAYRVFEHLMSVRFKQLFADQFQILKIKMYQFQRLLAVFHPEISSHFKRQAVSPECYIVSWIITLFASSYQYTMQSYLIDRLWERFIIFGWKQFFKFVLWMFDLKKQELIQLTYDRALHSLGEIAKSKFLLASNKQYAQMFADVQDVDKGMDRYEVTQEMLDAIVAEYKLLKH